MHGRQTRLGYPERTNVCGQSEPHSSAPSENEPSLFSDRATLGVAPFHWPFEKVPPAADPSRGGSQSQTLEGLSWTKTELL